MNGGTGKEREERAVDALLISALRQQDSTGTDITGKSLPELTDDERAAMKALGSNFIQRLLAGERPLGAPAEPDEDCPDESEELALAGSGADSSLNRAEEVDDETAKELEQREREILDAKPASEKTVEVTTPLDIEDEAKKTLLALGMWRLPVDPMAIAKEEGIELAPGRYSEKFDARIKYVRSAKTFILSYREACEGLTEGRVRFSIGHELGHFYLVHHRKYLLSGQTHRSVSDFRSRDPREMEADEFSSALLMPSALFAGALKSRNMTVCTLADLSRLAENAFHTSLTSTVRRYVGFDWEACSMVVSKGGVVKWAEHSDSMKALHMGWIEYGSRIPNTTPTAKLWERLGREVTLDRVEGLVDADIWFERPYRPRLWEEAMPLGYTGLVLTFLTVDEE